MIAISSAVANDNRHLLISPGNGAEIWKTHYINADIAREKDRTVDANVLMPQAFLVDQKAEEQLLPHFHEVDQFQVVVSGNGRIGQREVGSIAIQYAGAYTPYGPIHAGPQGLKYFTLRNAFERRSYYMPQSREYLRSKPGKPRQTLAAVGTPASAEQLRQLSNVSCSAIIAPTADGLAAWLYRLPPGHSVTGAAPDGGRGQHWLTLAGSIAGGELDGAPALSLAFVAPDDPAYTVTAGDDGLEVLVMQFPFRLAA